MLVATSDAMDPEAVAVEEGLDVVDVFKDAFAQRQELKALETRRAQMDAVLVAVTGPKIVRGILEAHALWAKRSGAEQLRNCKATAERWIAVMGDKPVAAFTQEDCQAFLDKNNADKVPPVQQVRHRVHMHAMLEVACKAGWRTDNPMKYAAVDGEVKKAAAKKNKKPFKPEQVAMILEKAAAAWANKPDLLLALRMLVYSGARSNEICGLRTCDIENKDGVMCIVFREGPGQSIKNEPSQRYIPIHAAVRKEVLARVEAGGEWLFPTFNHENPTKHNARFLEAFNGRRVDGKQTGLLRGVCGITDKGLSAHSLRHAFKDALRLARVDEETRKEIMGHGKGCVHGNYGAELVELMVEAIEHVDPLSGALRQLPGAAVYGRNSGTDVVRVDEEELEEMLG
jgi:integrase